jgi:hypothetical protein
MKKITDRDEQGMLHRLLGAVAYRAGRLDECLDLYGKGFALPVAIVDPRDYAILAMAHHRKGNRAEARRWLAKLAAYRVPDGPIRTWEELRTAHYRCEAESLILYDPAFPADPFAPSA